MESHRYLAATVFVLIFRMCGGHNRFTIFFHIFPFYRIVLYNTINNTYGEISIYVVSFVMQLFYSTCRVVATDCRYFSNKARCLLLRNKKNTFKN